MTLTGLFNSDQTFIRYISFIKNMPKTKGFKAPDDQPLFVIKRDLGGGMNTRENPQMIGENQAALLQNIMLETADQTSIRPGQTLVDVNYPL